MSLKEIHNLDYTVLICEDLEKTRAFYKDVMGFPIENDLERWVDFRVGSTVLSLRPRGRGLAWEDGPIEPESASVQLGFRVPPSAVDSCHEELLARGATILTGPTDLPAWRHRAMFFLDPEGNILEIYAEY